MEWLVAPGGAVAVDDVIVIIETDKAIHSESRLVFQSEDSASSRERELGASRAPPSDI